jgi:mRNA interferase YafQ
MYTVNYTSQFKRAVKLCNRRGLDVNKIAELVDILRVRGVLPRKYKPHKLSGYKGGMTWECHIEPDWLLIWEQNDTHLTLLMLETGTHSDLFG